MKNRSLIDVYKQTDLMLEDGIKLIQKLCGMVDVSAKGSDDPDFLQIINEAQSLLDRIQEIFTLEKLNVIRTNFTKAELKTLEAQMDTTTRKLNEFFCIWSESLDRIGKALFEQTAKEEAA